jgi:NhaP-type Na+/H+ and K+/H+ antiporter
VLAGTLLLVGVVASGLTARFRIPSLLMLFGLGMLVVDNGLARVRFVPNHFHPAHNESCNSSRVWTTPLRC